MRKLTNKDLKYIFIAFIIVSIFFITTIDTKGQETEIEPVYYDFSNDVLFDIDQENDPSYYNIKNQTIYNGYYESGYTNFDNIEYDDLSEVNADFQVSDSYNGHNLILHGITGGVASGDCQLSHSFEAEADGFIEVWLSVSDITNGRNRFFVLHDGVSTADENTIIRIQLQANQFIARVGNGAGGTMPFVLKTTAYDGIWYHLKMYINCVSDSIDFYCNNEYIGNGNFCNDQDFDYFSTIFISSGGAGDSQNFDIYADALDFSWLTEYTENRSFYQIPESTNQLEVDKFEFNYDIDDFETDLCGWTQTEKDASTNQIYLSETNDIEKELIFYMFYGSVYTQQLNFDGISNSQILNISMAINPSSISIYDFRFYFIMNVYNRVDAYDNVAFWLYDIDDSFRILNQETKAYETVFTYTQDQIIYINIYLNSYDNLMIYRIQDGSDNYEFIYNYDPEGKDLYGFYNAYFYASCSETSNPSSFQVDIDSFGIYENGLSYINNTQNYEFGLMKYQLWDTWNSDTHNLLTIDSLNDYTLYVHEYDTYFLDGYRVRERNNQTELEVINLQDKIDNNYPKFIKDNPMLLFQVYGNCTNFYEIEIEGIQLIDDSGNIAYANYYYNNSNSNFNWFYVIGNKLYYYFNNSQSSGIETMKITFNINDILLDDSVFVSYTAFLLNNYTGQIDFRSYYSTESYGISNNISNPNSLYNLTDYEHFTLTEISIIIETDLLDTAQNITEGYIQNINFYPEKPLIPEFEPIEYLDSTFLEKMIETIIPILFFLVPSFMIKTRYGNKAVLPIWILMTFIFMIVNFIPFWIAFIIFLGIGLMTLTKDEVIE